MVRVIARSRGRGDPAFDRPSRPIVPGD